MKWLTIDAGLFCDHRTGKVQLSPSQSLVRVNQRRVLVEPDPVGKPIAACNFVGPAQKPCLITLVVQQGYSGLVTIDGRRVCLDTVVGGTDGSPGVFTYTVRTPGQSLVETLL